MKVMIEYFGANNLEDIKLPEGISVVENIEPLNSIKVYRFLDLYKDEDTIYSIKIESRELFHNVFKDCYFIKSNDEWLYVDPKYELEF